MGTSSRVREILVVAVTFALMLTATPPARAQYFGRNKVQYRHFTFQVIETEPFDVYFCESEREAAQQAARMAERWYARLSRILAHDLERRQPILLYASHVDFEQTNAVSGMIDEGTGGVTEALKKRVILPFAASLAETDHVLGHELVHTVAARVMHVGRYGPDAQNPLLLPLYLGQTELVRGYETGSFTASECTSTLGGSCPAYDQLAGSRLLVGNLELRFPLLRPFGARSGMYGPVPVEVAFFSDNGVA